MNKERANHIQEQINYHKQRQQEALEVYYEANDRITELTYQLRAEMGQAALFAVQPNLFVINGGNGDGPDNAA